MNHEIYESLNQIQAIKSVAQIQAAVQALITKLKPHVETEPPKFGGNPGEPVPEVDPEDIKTCWEMAREAETRNPGQVGAIGTTLLQQVFKPGADIKAVTYRGGMLWMLDMVAHEQLAAWKKDGQVDDSVFRTAATIPMEWMGVGIVRQGPPFDVDEFFRRLREGQAGGSL